MILGASILQLPAIKQAKKMGHQVIAVDMDPLAIGFSVEGVIKEVISTIDKEAVLYAAIKHNIDGIMTLASDMPMQTIAYISGKLKLPSISVSSSIKVTNKRYMREALKKENIPIPLFAASDNLKSLKPLAKKIFNKNIKCILKPADSSGSRGVNLIESIDELESAFYNSQEYSKSGYVMLEEYMVGAEVSVESITYENECNVIQITDKMTTGAPNFVEMGHSQPSRNTKDIKESIIQLTKAATKVLGINYGPSHTEIIITKDGPKIVEIGARLGGDNITSHLVPFSTGVNMIENCIKLALSEAPNLIKEYNNGSAIRYIKADHGEIVSIEGIEKAREISNIKEVVIVNDKLSKPIKSSTDRIGYVIAQAENAEIAVEACEKALSYIKVGVKSIV